MSCLSRPFAETYTEPQFAVSCQFFSYQLNYRNEPDKFDTKVVPYNLDQSENLCQEKVDASSYPN